MNRSEAYKIIVGPDKIRIIMDPSQVFPHDPGQGTPVLVELKNGDTATWNCAINEGETADGNEFTDEQMKWLNKQTPKVEQWMKDHNA